MYYKYLVKRLCLLRRLKIPELIPLIESYLLDNKVHSKLVHHITMNQSIYPIIKQITKSHCLIHRNHPELDIGKFHITICYHCQNLIYFQHKTSNNSNLLHQLLQSCCFTI